MGLFDKFKKKDKQEINQASIQIEETKQTPTLMEDLITAKTWIAEALQSSGYTADFSFESLREVDRFFDDVVDDEAHTAKPGSVLEENTGMKLFSLGAYVGSTIIATCGGEWLTDDEDLQGEVNVAIKLPSGSIIWPVQKVMGRVMNGKEDAIFPYASIICDEE